MDSNCNLSGSNCQVLPGRRPEPLAVGAPIGGNETNVWHKYVKRRALVRFMSHESTRVSRLTLAILRTSLDWFIAFGGDLLFRRIGMIAVAVILFCSWGVFRSDFAPSVCANPANTESRLQSRGPNQPESFSILQARSGKPNGGGRVFGNVGREQCAESRIRILPRTAFDVEPFRYRNLFDTEIFSTLKICVHSTPHFKFPLIRIH
ncbi:hypothetical protein Pla52n_60750 [Stieleria varia]|uniref:Uncharacterized protein n=1 Tax=Stieleria varia TaxID=2528005 RepID=A0A5C6A059_9BACT|nr:hypothetical protein Pla52n_60750 [Stieleria varia]